MPRKRATPKTINLAKGRPPTATKPEALLSKRATQNIIRSHHQLSKQLAIAETDEDEEKVNELKDRLTKLGGLKSYQMVSMMMK